MGCSSSKGVEPPSGALQDQGGREPPASNAFHSPCSPGPGEGPTLGSSPPALLLASAYLDEQARLRSTRELGIMGPQPRFDCITSLLRRIFDVEVALIALTEAETLKFVASAGDCPANTQRAGFFCEWLLVPENPSLFVVEDAALDPRFKDHPCVLSSPNIRFFAGAPLVGTESGDRYGTLCLLGSKPQRFTAEQYAVLTSFAEVVARELERNKVIEWQRQQLHADLQDKHMLRALDCFRQGVCLLNCRDPQWPILYANDAWARLTGARGQDPPSREQGFWDLFSACALGSSAACLPENGAAAEQGMRVAAADRKPFNAVVECKGSGVTAAAVPTAAAAAAAAVAAAATTAAGERGGEAAAGGVALLLLRFRPSSTAHPIGQGETDIAIPSYVEDEGASSPVSNGRAGRPLYYFVTVQPAAPGKHALARPFAAAGSAGGAGAGSCQASDVELGLHTASVCSVSSWEGFKWYLARRPEGSLCSSGDHRLGHQAADATSQVVLGSLIGKGSLGLCYRGLWCRKRVAVKLIPLKASIAEFKERGSSPEAAVAASLAGCLCRRGPGSPGAQGPEDLLPGGDLLTHPNLVQSYGFGVGAKAAAGNASCLEVWLLQSYCKKGDLLSAIERGLLQSPDGRPNLPLVLHTAQDVVAAMEYLHMQGAAHGHVSSRNVLLSSSDKNGSCRDGRRWVAQVSDFGLSDALSPFVGHTRSLKTFTHMPAELLVDGALSPAADIYSAGVLLVEMWSGKRAWAGMRPGQVMAAVVSGPGLEPPPDMPPELAALARRCLARKVSDRPAVAELAASISTLLHATESQDNPEPAAASAAAGKGAAATETAG